MLDGDVLPQSTMTRSTRKRTSRWRPAKACLVVLDRTLAERLGAMGHRLSGAGVARPRLGGERVNALTGKRLPDLELKLPTGAVKRLYSFMHGQAATPPGWIRSGRDARTG